MTYDTVIVVLLERFPFNCWHFRTRNFHYSANILLH